MVDIATVVLKADTSDLKRGEAALETLGATGVRTERQIDGATKGIASDFNKVAVSARSAGAAVETVGRTSGGAARGIQNAAFQIEDFAVQVGAGQRASLALAQQLPQLLGGFGVLGAVAGAAVAIMVPLGAALFQSGEAAKSFDGSLDALSTSLAEIRGLSDLAGASAKDIIKIYGEATEAVYDLIDAQRTLEIQRALQTTRDMLGEIDRSFFDLRSSFNDIRSPLFGLTKGAIELSQAFNLSREAAEEMQQNLLLLKSSETITEQIDAMALLRAQMELVLDEQGGLTSEAQAFYEQLVQSEDAARRVSAQVERAKTQTAGAADEAERFAAGLRGAYNAQTFLLQRRFADEEALFSQEVAFTPPKATSAPRASSGARGGGGVSPDVREAERVFNSTRTAAELYSQEIKDLERLLGGGLISQNTFTRAVEKAKATLDAAKGSADPFARAWETAISGVANAFGDFVGQGFKDFKGFVSSVVDSFKNMIAQMVAYAAKNKILMSLGFAGTGTAASAQTLGGSLGGGLLGLGKSIGGAFGGGLSGIGSTTASGGLLAGLGQSFGSIGSIFSGGGLGALGAAMPALGIIGGAAFAIFNLFKKKPPISKADFKAVQTGLELTGKELLNTAFGGQKAAANIRNAAGGIEEFTQASQFFAANFISSAEQRKRAEESLSSTFEGLGIAAPKTAKAFADLVAGIDLNDRSGQELYGTLLRVSPAFAELYGTLNDTAGAAQVLADVLNGNGGMFATLLDAQRAAAYQKNGIEFIGPTGFRTGNGATVALTDQAVFAKLDELVTAVNVGNAQVAKNTGKALKVFTEWNAIGLPATAT